jgi:hypothetical protein
MPVAGYHDSQQSGSRTNAGDERGSRDCLADGGRKKAPVAVATGAY